MWSWRRAFLRDSETLTIRIPVSRQLLFDGELDNVAAIVQALAGETARAAVWKRAFEVRGQA